MSRELDYALTEIKNELRRAQENYPPFNSAHEGYAIMLEEMEELFEHVKVKQKNRNISAMGEEAKQIAAMAIRFYLDCCTPEGKGYGK
jgi:hypothetical protein